MPLYTGGRIDAGIRQAEAGISASEAQLSAAVQTLMLDVVTAYSDVLRDRETIKIRENSVALLSEQVRAAKDRFDVGVVTRTDVAQAEARLEGAVAGLSGAEAQLEASEAGYEFLVGQPAGALAPLPETPVLPETFDAALAIAIAENPDLLALRDNERVAREAVEAARGEMRPSVSIVGTAGYQENFEDNFEDTSVAALAQATIPLYQGGRVSSSVRQAKLQASQARLQTQNAERQVRAQVAQSWFATLAAERAIIASERQVEAAEIAYEGAKEELAVGVRTTLDVLDQEQQLLEARLGLITARRDFYVASYQLLRSMGRLGYETVAS
jgi:outer membrane protein